MTMRGRTQLLDLPQEIIRTILCKLPVKNLIICSCVSPQWLRMISAIEFRKHYHKLSLEQKTLQSRIMVSTDTEIQSFALKDLENSIRHDCPFKKASRQLVRPLATCNGFVFTALEAHDNFDFKSFFIWNPSTGFSLKLRDPPQLRKLYDFVAMFHLCQSGFVYMSGIDDYKAFVNIYVHTGNEMEYAHQWVLVYSLKSRTWTKIENRYNQCFDYCLESSGILLNEKLHWLQNYNILRGSHLYSDSDDAKLLNAKGIVVFDPEEEQWNKILLPSIYDDDGEFEINMGLSEGCLCLVDIMRRTNDNSTLVHFWVMNEYGVSKSWSKLFSIQINRSMGKLIRIHPPVLVMETTLVVMFGESEFTRIDTKQGTTEDIDADPMFLDNPRLVYQETPLFLEKKVKNEQQRKRSRERKCLK